VAGFQRARQAPPITQTGKKFASVVKKISIRFTI